MPVPATTDTVAPVVTPPAPVPAATPVVVTPAPVPVPVRVLPPAPLPVAPVPVAAPAPVVDAPVVDAPDKHTDDILAADTHPDSLGSDIPVGPEPTVIVTEHQDAGHGVDAVLAVLLLVLWRTVTRRIGRHEGKVESLLTSADKSKLDGEALAKALKDANTALDEVRVLREAVAVLSVKPAAPVPKPKPRAPKKKD